MSRTRRSSRQARTVPPRRRVRAAGAVVPSWCSIRCICASRSIVARTCGAAVRFRVAAAPWCLRQGAPAALQKAYKGYQRYEAKKAAHDAAPACKELHAHEIRTTAGHTHRHSTPPDTKKPVPYKRDGQDARGTTLVPAALLCTAGTQTRCSGRTRPAQE